MKISSFFAILFVPFFCWGQFSVNGTLVNHDNIPVANCPIKLLQADNVMKTAISADNGAFAFQEIPQGTYTIEIISVFYDTYTQQVLVNSNVSLGTISIAESVQELKEVVVSAQKNPIVPTATGTLIEVAGSRLSNRPDIFSILNYAPSISTINGLKIFGSDAILVVFDGKELNLSKDKIVSFLSSIPIKSIRNIEVVDKVGADVDASKAGVIKINTIQRAGWSGSLMQSVFHRKEFGYTSDASLFYGTEHFRVFGMLYHGRSNSFMENTANQSLKNQNLIYNSFTNASLKRKENFFDFGFDYYLSENSGISFLYILGYDADADHNRNTPYGYFQK
ncbi:MAG: TonB-dependent receptor [Capnocytophaga sp.]|nr:TonB-dependent receptor [Capnocytophaga sp.]